MPNKDIYQYEPDQLYDTVQKIDPSLIRDDAREVFTSRLPRLNNLCQEMGFPRYHRDEALMLGYYTCLAHHLHKNNFRKDEVTPYVKHLIGTADNHANLQGRVDLDEQVAAYEHDDIEDLPVTEEELCPIEGLKEHLSILPWELVEEFRRSLHRQVKGVTKVKGLKRFDEKETALTTLFESMIDENEGDFRCPNLKVSDRIHNMATLSGMGADNMDRQMDVSRTTVAVYMPISGILGITKAREELVNHCAAFLNPKLLDAYQKIIQSKRAEFIDPYMHEFMIRFCKNVDSRIGSIANIIAFENPFIKRVKIEPRGLGEMLNHVHLKKPDIPFENITISDLPILEEDPLHEIVVLVDNPSNFAAVMGYLISKFADASRPQIKSQELPFQAGISLKIINPKLGTRLFFRINHTITEARRKRGLDIKYGSEKDREREIKQKIKELLERVRDTRESIQEIATKEFLLPTKTTFTWKGKPIVGIRGETTLDFAGRIHTDVLKGAQSAKRSDIFLEEIEDISLFEVTPDKSAIYVETCLSNNPHIGRDPNQIKLTPGWIYQCKSTTTKNIIRDYFRKKENGELLDEGKKFLNTLSTLYQLDQSQIISLIRHAKPKNNKLSTSSIHKKLGRCDIPILEILSKDEQFAKQNQWIITVDLKDEPRSMATFSEILQKNGQINIVDLGKIIRREGEMATLEFTINYNPNRFSAFEFLKTILKVHYEGYNLSIRPFEEGGHTSVNQLLDRGG